MMKKIFAAAAVVGMSIGTAHAVPFSWSDINDPTDFKINDGDTYDYTHIFTDGPSGFRVGVDTITSAELRIWLYDDSGSDGGEYVDFRLDGSWYGSYSVDGSSGSPDDFDFDFSSSPWYWLVGDLSVTTLADGSLSVRVKNSGGDFYFKKSELTVWGDRAATSTSVPEPATLGLFGLGLLGVAFGMRRKQA